MKLNQASIINQADIWKEKGYQLPSYDREKVKADTIANPNWIHLGAGNIFRAFQANVLENLLNAGETEIGLIVAEGYDYEIIDAAYKKFDDLGVFVRLRADGFIDKTVVGSVVESLKLNENTADFETLKAMFRNQSLQMVSFTITEKGYSLVAANGELLPNVADDIKQGPALATSYMGKVTALVYERFKANQLGIALVSMDNCSHNGDKLKAAILGIASAWAKNRLVEEAFIDYLNDTHKVSFPWSMIDKITPRPDDSVKAILIADGLEDMEATVTSKNTYVAPFVNAEEAEYLVIEDAFPNGRPALEKGGVIFTARETVDKVEKMKVCTCLNPLHTALAIYGCLLGYTKISEEMKDSNLKELVEIIGYKEGLPVVVNPGIIDPKEFIDTVLGKRIPNPFMPDTPQRIACDTSQKLGIRFGETVKAYMAAENLDISSLKLIPLVYAGWCRYLMAIDDNGNAFALSPDPALEKVQPIFADIKLGETLDIHAKLSPILSDEAIFGINLYDAGLGDLTENYFKELISGVGAVRSTLIKYTSEYSV